MSTLSFSPDRDSFGAESAPIPDPESVCEQIGALSDVCPELIALSAGGKVLTYRQLNHKADLFANYLSGCGVLAGDSVAICMERSFEWVIAALGIMRAGAAYVPLDPAWPDLRLSYAVRDSGATALVSRAATLSRLQVDVRGVDPYRDEAAIAGSRGSSPRNIPSNRLAYIIYTSGSTGVPKGVEITHNNLCHLTRWHKRAFNVTWKDRVSHLAGLGFDAAAWEIWPNLSAGATILLADEEVRSSPELLQQWIIRESVTVAFVPTVHATPLMSMQWPANTKLRYLLTGGNTLQQAPPAGLPFQVVNNYGPTECTVVSTSGLIVPAGDKVPSIGLPIDATSIYILDELGRTVPDGTPGEIYIGGGGVGRGYRNLSAPTAQFFLPDRFSGAPEALMFRTGDRAVRLPNGELQFLGRRDRQIKIRGYRVELDEIGAVLSRHPCVAFATVTATTSEQGEVALVGYVQSAKDSIEPAVDELQTYLLESLPAYMVPSRFVRLDALPVSPNGKLDFALLPPAEELEPLRRKTATPITSPIEERLLIMVRQLLENDGVTADEDFFLAGGHSLLAMQLLTRLQTAFGMKLSLQQLFESPTVSELAVIVEQKLLDGIDAMTDEEAEQSTAQRQNYRCCQ